LFSFVCIHKFPFLAGSWEAIEDVDIGAEEDSEGQDQFSQVGLPRQLPGVDPGERESCSNFMRGEMTIFLAFTAFDYMCLLFLQFRIPRAVFQVDFIVSCSLKISQWLVYIMYIKN